MLACLLAPVMFAQKFEVSPFAGVTTGGKIPVDLQAADPANPDIPNTRWLGLGTGPNFGISAGYRFSRYFEGEARWSQQRTAGSARGEDGRGQGQRLSGTRVDQFHGNLLFHFREVQEAKIQPYLLFGAGVGRIAPTDTFQGTSTTFSFGVGGGIKAYFNRRIGLRAQFRYAPTKYDTGRSAVWCVQSGSCYTLPRNRDDWATIPNYWNQYEFSIGPIFRF